MTGTQVALTEDHRAAGGDVFEGVLSDVVAPLKQDSATVQVHPVVQASVSFCPGMPH
jgi:hypothetical protein